MSHTFGGLVENLAVQGNWVGMKSGHGGRAAQ
jgi:hypothetical protein